MNKNKLFKYVFFFIVLIYFLDFMGSKLYLYTSIHYYDIIMHFLGGFWLCILFLWVFYKDINNINKKIIFFKTFLSSLFIILSWEFYEFFVNNLFAKNKFDLIDTISDIIFGILGFLISYYIFTKILKNNKNNI